MKTKLNDGALTLIIEGRVDSTVAPALTEEIDGALAQNAHTSVTIDARNLEYISSAGLRTLLKLRKEEPTLRVINASADVYDIFSMTGFSEIIPITKAYRELSVEGCEIIGKGAKGTVYRYDPETIVKLYHDPGSLPVIQNERALARRAFVLGIPTAISYDVVRVGDQYGSVFELLSAKTFSELLTENPDRFGGLVNEFAGLLRQIHETPVTEDDMPDIKPLVRQWVEADAAYLLPGEKEKIGRMIDEVPDVMTLIHGDFHTNNILMQGDDPILIDMDTLSHGHPVFELANVYITYVGFGEIDPAVVENFIHLPYDVSVRFFRAFLPAYLGTTDEERVRSVENKVRLLSYLRLLRHIVRRGVNTEKDFKTVAHCKQNITKLLETVDSLAF